MGSTQTILIIVAVLAAVLGIFFLKRDSVKKKRALSEIKASETAMQADLKIEQLLEPPDTPPENRAEEDSMFGRNKSKNKDEDKSDAAVSEEFATEEATAEAEGPTTDENAAVEQASEDEEGDSEESNPFGDDLDLMNLFTNHVASDPAMDALLADMKEVDIYELLKDSKTIAEGLKWETFGIDISAL